MYFFLLSACISRVYPEAKLWQMKEEIEKLRKLPCNRVSCAVLHVIMMCIVLFAYLIAQLDDVILVDPL